jgi:hypothetical protein
MTYYVIAIVLLFIACAMMAMVILDYKTIIDCKNIDIEALNKNITKLNNARNYWIKRFKNLQKKVKKT